MKIDDWLPIETAPKDGTEVLLYRSRLTGMCIDVGAWLESRPQDFFITGWMSNGITVEPTHWMPLPEPPQ